MPSAVHAICLYPSSASLEMSWGLFSTSQIGRFRQSPPSPSADALPATLYGHFTQAIYRNRPIGRASGPCLPRVPGHHRQGRACQRAEVHRGQGLTLVHFLATLEPYLTRNTPFKPPTLPNTPCHLLNTRRITPKQILNATPYPIESA
jgi:hypothetical protein